jgi:hypothetical protein
MYVSDTFCSELHYRADWRFCPISLNPSSEIKVSRKAHSMGGTEAALSGPGADGDQDVRSYRTPYVDLIQYVFVYLLTTVRAHLLVRVATRFFILFTTHHLDNYTSPRRIWLVKTSQRCLQGNSSTNVDQVSMVCLV